MPKQLNVTENERFNPINSPISQNVHGLLR